MASATSNLYPDCTVTANVKAWMNFIHNLFVSAGWTQTADSGQIAISSVTGTAATNNNFGFEIWKTTDGVGTQFFVKIEYSSAATAGYPRVYFTVGTGSNGSGTLTGAGARQVASCVGTSTTTQYTCTGAGGTGWIVFCLFQGANIVLSFGCERTKTNSGGEDTTGMFTFVAFPTGQGTSNSWSASQLIPASGAVGVTCPYIPVVGIFITKVVGSVDNIAPVVPQSNQTTFPNALLLCGIYPGDIGTGASITIPRYGVNHTYYVAAAATLQDAPGSMSSSIGNGGVNLWTLCHRYE